MSTEGTTQVAAAALSRATVEQQSARLGEPAWARERRLAAWEAFERLPAPAVARPEEWRRTDVGALDLGALAVPDPQGSPARQGRHGPLVRDEATRAGWLAHADGRTVGRALRAELARAGVVFTDLACAMREHEALVREHLFALASPEEHRFRALHGALWSAGTFLYVPPGVEVALPLVAQTWLGTPGGVVFPHTLVVADQGSRVALIETFASAPAERRALASGVVELIARPGAQVRYAAVQE
ncbi:MAG: Fe-S cluster assembly protein SufD, partial [Armatimonadota bacterium]|nr:Fe-S cluster assembly protein SufD [Armatimonadota bacterium]